MKTYFLHLNNVDTLRNSEKSHLLGYVCNLMTNLSSEDKITKNVPIYLNPPYTHMRSVEIERLRKEQDELQKSLGASKSASRRQQDSEDAEQLRSHLTQKDEVEEQMEKERQNQADLQQEVSSHTYIPMTHTHTHTFPHTHFVFLSHTQNKQYTTSHKHVQSHIHVYTQK